MEPLSIRRGKSRAINAENPTGEKGRGGMASSNLGKSRKGSPCLTNIAPGDEVVLADIRELGSSRIYGSQWMIKPVKQIALLCVI